MRNKVTFGVSLGLSAAVIAVLAIPLAYADGEKGKATQGIHWEKSLDAAKVRAAKEGKPILFHQLVGDLDKEGC